MHEINDQTAWIEALATKTAKSEKNWHLALVLSLCFGWLGVDRLYLERPVIAVLKFLTCVCGVLAIPIQGDVAAFVIFGLGMLWWLTDIVLLLSHRMKDAHGKIVMRP